MAAMKRRRAAISLRTLLAIIGVICIVLASYRAWYWNRYPHGRTHACDMLLKMMLVQYADANNGAFPAGQSTAEASLSLLYRMDPNVAYLLAGKSASVEDAERLLSSGQLLDPKTCSWHYVEGLRKTDDPRLALFWDKVGSGHHGERMPDGGHNVWFIGAQHRWVPVEEWPSFIKEQEKILPKRPGISPSALEQR
jgi:hypothetical protein